MLKKSLTAAGGTGRSSRWPAAAPGRRPGRRPARSAERAASPLGGGAFSSLGMQADGPFRIRPDMQADGPFRAQSAMWHERRSRPSLALGAVAPAAESAGDLPGGGGPPGDPACLRRRAGTAPVLPPRGRHTL